MTTYTFLAATYSDPEHRTAIAITREASAVALSSIDTPGEWSALHDWGQPAPFMPTPPPALRTYKSPMFRRMTDAEYDAYLQIRAAFPPRLQAIFDAAEYLSSDDEFWPSLVAAAEQAYGQERAAEILAPTP